MQAKVMIAEDEPLMRERLLGLIAKGWPEAEVVLVAENGNDAWDGFLEHEPQVVFLDIRMPGLSGLEVAERIGKAAHVVFVTAFDQYAVEAFDASAVDYLLKPVQPERFARALDRIRARLVAPPADLGAILQQLKAVLPAKAPEKLKWIKATVGKQLRLIDVQDVLFFQADSKYTRVVLRDTEALVRIALKDLLGQLDADCFWQIHRGTMVNVKAIDAVERVDAERLQVLVKGCDERLVVSRTFTHLFRD